MIENLILKFLKKDDTLCELLGGGESGKTNCNIFPDVGQVTVLPCVIMSADSPTSPTDNPWDFTQNLTFDIYAQTERTAQQIRNRLYQLLDKYDDFFLSDQASGIIIRESHAVSASVSNHFPNDTEQAKEKVVSFDFRFTKCA